LPLPHPTASCPPLHPRARPAHTCMLLGTPPRAPLSPTHTTHVCRQRGNAWGESERGRSNACTVMRIRSTMSCFLQASPPTPAAPARRRWCCIDNHPKGFARAVHRNQNSASLPLLLLPWPIGLLPHWYRPTVHALDHTNDHCLHVHATNTRHRLVCRRSRLQS
jgi:hypothetical protein